jgi:hypothetical protein
MLFPILLKRPVPATMLSTRSLFGAIGYKLSVREYPTSTDHLGLGLPPRRESTVMGRRAPSD